MACKICKLPKERNAPDDLAVFFRSVGSEFEMQYALASLFESQHATSVEWKRVLDAGNPHAMTFSLALQKALKAKGILKSEYLSEAGWTEKSLSQADLLAESVIKMKSGDFIGGATLLLKNRSIPCDNSACANTYGSIKEVLARAAFSALTLTKGQGNLSRQLKERFLSSSKQK